MQRGPQVGATEEWRPVQNYYWPLEAAAEAAVEEVWQQLLAEDGVRERAVTLPVIYGRSLEAGPCTGSAVPAALPCMHAMHVHERGMHFAKTAWQSPQCYQPAPWLLRER